MNDNIPEPQTTSPVGIPSDGAVMNSETADVVGLREEAVLAELVRMQKQQAREFKKLEEKARRQRRIRSKQSRKRNRRG